MMICSMVFSMDVSVDTNVLIHLYNAFSKDVLFSSFEKVYVFDYIIDEELRRNAPKIYAEVNKDISDGRISKIRSADLVSMGLKKLFEEQYRAYQILFAGDRGEAYAIALAGVLGIEAFVSDDTKVGGPHETLLKEYIEDIIPFTFYELLFLQFLKSELTCEEFKSSFDQISSTMSKPMRFTTKIKMVLKRYHKKHCSERDYQWLTNYCIQYQIEMRERIHELGAFIKRLEDSAN